MKRNSSLDFALDCLQDIVSMADTYKDLADNHWCIKRQKLDSSAEYDSEISIKYIPTEAPSPASTFSSPITEIVINAKSDNFWSTMITMEMEKREWCLEQDLLPIDSVGFSPFGCLPIDSMNDFHDIQSISDKSTQAIVVTEADFPFVVVHVNEPWTKVCEYKKEEMIGNTLGMLQGKDTEVESIRKLAQKTSSCQDGTVRKIDVTNYKKSGIRFTNHLQIRSLKCQDDKRYLMGIVQERAVLNN